MQFSDFYQTGKCDIWWMQQHCENFGVMECLYMTECWKVSPMNPNEERRCRKILDFRRSKSASQNGLSWPINWAQSDCCNEASYCCTSCWSFELSNPIVVDVPFIFFLPMLYSFKRERKRDLVYVISKYIIMIMSIQLISLINSILQTNRCWSFLFLFLFF